MTGAAGTREIPFNALAPAVRGLRAELDAAVARVLDSGWFILGPAVAGFEQAFAAYHGEAYQSVGVGCGTDALVIGLRALGIQPGDEVLTVANAGIPTVAAVVAAGGVPVFCDVDPTTHGLDPLEVERRVTPRTRVLLVVHLYGCPAAMDRLVPIARRHGLRILEDCAQAHGARLGGRLVGTFGDAAAFSFYPTKNLGALGDAGAVLTRDPSVADAARLLRQYGWRQPYYSEVQSTVSRLDELQAAILAVKLPRLDGWNARRRALADRYTAELQGLARFEPPRTDGAAEPVFHLYVGRVPGGRRKALRAWLTERGIGTAVHYPEPAHLQAPYRAYGAGPGSLPVTEALAREVVSLPLYPDLSDEDARYVAQQVRAWAEAARAEPLQG